MSDGFLDINHISGVFFATVAGTLPDRIFFPDLLDNAGVDYVRKNMQFTIEGQDFIFKHQKLVRKSDSAPVYILRDNYMELI